jgi:hypothetical protein
MLWSDIWDMFSLGHFDPIKQMIPLTVIPLSGAHFTYKSNYEITVFNVQYSLIN